ncbi:MAG: hypothetical protein GXO65_03990, partial [Euryarchaeota archaeon]|nr:hypothetical protein [Euryarchaeota archaeon]
CRTCISGGELCPECSEKLASGSISQLEIEVQRAVHGLGERFPGTRDVVIKRVLPGDGMIVIVTDRKGVGPLIGRGGRVVKLLSRKLKRKIRVLSESKDLKVLIQDALYPVPLLGLNIVYHPGTEERYRALVPAQEVKRLPIERQALEKLLKDITGKEIIITPED